MLSKASSRSSTAFDWCLRADAISSRLMNAMWAFVTVSTKSMQTPRFSSNQRS